ncbi:MAG TPA: hypothetical protein VK817_09570 [Trebonia sp.]|nr:hypothetical protein [Trebonia sp.]
MPAPLDLARQVVFGAVDYARGLGFEPHADFAKCAAHLGEASWDGSCDITFGRAGKPTYLQEPHDNAIGIMSTLRENVGDGNFEYLQVMR